MLSVTEHLLVVLGEECAEVSHRASKALRFGLDEKQLGHGETNAERIVGELQDLYAVVEMLSECAALNGADPNRLAIDDKKAKVRKYLAYARNLGTVEKRLEA